MLTGFENYRAQTYNRTTFLVSKNRIMSVAVNNGPGGFIELTDNELDQMLSFIDPQMRIGNKWPDITSAQAENYPSLTQIFDRVNQERLSIYDRNPSPHKKRKVT